METVEDADAYIMFRLVGGRFGDYRDWAAIDAWASEISDAPVGVDRGS
ncbi:hypothetical protein [Streptomyces sp. SAS_270]